jgi:formylglycine-generating enzyme required for sulfatase activity
LDLAGNDLDDAAIRALLASPRLGRLVWLDLRGNRLSDGAVAALVEALPWRLARLDLRHNDLTADGMRALLDSPLGRLPAGLELNAPDHRPETVRDLVAWRRERDLAERIGGLPARLVNGLGMEFRLVPPGAFLMGSLDTDPGAYLHEKPQHEVEITRPFYLGAYPVTQREYQAVMGDNPSYFVSGRLGGPLHPVENISWDGAREFCERLSAREQGRRYELPTEAEWEYACRAGTETPFHFGEALNGIQARCDGQHPCGTKVRGPFPMRSCRVGTYAANAFGLYDMHGNVWEWCADYYDPEYYRRSSISDPFNGEKGEEERRVQRGGSWADFALVCRAAARAGLPPAFCNNVMGFRVALRLD